ncbi:MAG TPA: asparagine synthase (glutamine-hydrolyzing) [Pirellulales bacterium]|jgi:asparagine synthase (glutamine-hydrolysing)
MCGISGAAWTDAALAISRETLLRMTNCLRHRGPDDEGYFTSDVAAHHYAGAMAGVALGHRRLSIIDVAGSHQPLANEDETIWVVFNGEIYNYRDLHHRLEGSGHRFRTQGDTETLVHLYEDDGIDFLKHIDGMFSLAIWDSRKRRLVLARDRLGKKPLVYRHEAGRLLFASELKSLLAVPGVPRDVDPAALDEYLTYQYVPHPNTIFRGIRKLPPAHYAVYDEGGLSIGCYWRPDFTKEENRPEADYQAELRELLTKSVEKRLMSEVPLGAFLSGGIDSSIIVALMQQLSRERVKTFSIGFPVAEFDETSYAREVAQHLGTEHYEERVEPNGVEILPKLVWHYDEPFADSSAIPTYYVSKMTRRHVTVALSGDGGDELFAGYLRYQAVRLGEIFDHLPKSLRTLLAGEFWQRLPSDGRQRSTVRRFKRLAEGLSLPSGRRYLDWISVFNEANRAALYTDEFLARLPDSDPYDFLKAALNRSAGRDAVTAASLADLVTYLPCDLMTKVDIASMANSLECRTPFLDQKVVELAAKMPIRFKLRGRRQKRILLDTFGHLLPKSLRTRSKMGFAVPLAHWFRHELRDYAEGVLFDPVAQGRGYFRPEAVRALFDAHVAGSFDHSARLWALLFIELWHREWVDSPAESVR